MSATLWSDCTRQVHRSSSLQNRDFDSGTLVDVENCSRERPVTLPAALSTLNGTGRGNLFLDQSLDMAITFIVDEEVEATHDHLHAVADLIEIEQVLNQVYGAPR